MRIQIWGCRGSIPTSGRDFLRYGGNSTCLEIRSSDGAVIIVDAGSGVRNLGKALERDPSVRDIRFIFTHAHSDHLLGFPFFSPAYSSRFSITFCSGPHAQPSIQKYLARQMESPYFPVPFQELRAKLDFCCDGPTGEGPCSPAGLECRPAPLSHRNGGYGYRFFEDARSLVFLTDNELGVRHEDGLSRDGYMAFCEGADLLLHDAQYTEAEYRLTRGWGHSTYADAVDLALDAGVKRLGLFHHDPDRTDDDLDRQVAFCRERIRQRGSALECFAAAEGMIFEL